MIISCGGGKKMQRYRIGEVSKMVDVPVETIRFLEQKGLVSPEKNTGTGYRLYSVWDINLILDYKEVPQDRVQFQGDCGPGSGQQFCRSSGAAGCKKKGSCISGTLLSGQGPETEELPVCPGQCSGAGGKILYHEPPGKLFPLYQVSLRKEP
jgi:hypothetical protein